LVRWRRFLTALLSLAAFASLVPEASSASRPKRPLGDSRVVAHLPAAPGFPEGIAVAGRKMYVSAPAQFGFKGEGKVYAFDTRNGDLLREYTIAALDPNQDHALVGLALDGNGHLYVLDIQKGVVRIDLASGAQSIYAGPFPNLPPCSPGGATPCSPTTTDQPPLPNDPAFDSKGFLYVTDSFQATIWRIPPGGGPPQIWFQDPVLEGGANGLRMAPSGSKIYFVVSQGPNPAIYRLPRVERPNPKDLKLVHSYPEGPDGIAFGKSGKLYVALVLSNEISVLKPDGSEVHRFSGPARDDPAPVPWDSPANIAFDNASRALLVTNHAFFSGNADHFVVFDVFVKDRAQPLNQPTL
jgi:sugar lactone lactonase YvrE